MVIALWVVNALLALAFLGAGFMKVSKSKEALKTAGMGWVDGYSDGAVKAIGAAELAGAVGLILPLATHIAPILTPIAAVCLALTMVGAVVTHVRRSEPFTPALALGLLAVVSAVLGFLVV
ncbi:MAG: DoxX family protein [Arachnia sp.]